LFQEVPLSIDIRILVDRCLAGEQQAMLELVDTYKSRVFGLCFRMLGQWQDAEDVVQETFVRALKSLARWDSTRAFEPWLMAIAGNRCRTHLASRARKPLVQSLVEQIPESPSATEPGGEAASLAEELQLALGEIRSDYRQAFLLFHEQEMSYAEIGEAMECPLGTVKTWVHRARREIIARLEKRGVLNGRDEATEVGRCQADKRKTENQARTRS